MCIVALKGRNNTPAKGLLRPFRAWSLVLSRTQGDALGLIIPAFQAEERMAGAVRISMPPFRFRPIFQKSLLSEIRT